MFYDSKKKKIFFSPCEASDFWGRSLTDFLHDLRLRPICFLVPLCSFALFNTFTSSYEMKTHCFAFLFWMYSKPYCLLFRGGVGRAALTPCQRWPSLVALPHNRFVPNININLKYCIIADVYNWQSDFNSPQYKKKTKFCTNADMQSWQGNLLPEMTSWLTSHPVAWSLIPKQPAK